MDLQPRKDENGMILLPSHEAFENMLRPRRPTQDGFFDKYEPWVIVCFSASWCGPCKRLDKKFLVTTTPDVKWYSCDVDLNPTSLAYCSLKGIPSFAVIKDGTFLDKNAGMGSVEAILEWLHTIGVPVVLPATR